LAIALRRRHGRGRGSHRGLELQHTHECLRCPEAEFLPRSIPGRAASSQRCRPAVRVPPSCVYW
jgi:hypothetical protein